MSEFSVPVVRVGQVTKHSNADSLSIVEVEGCPCIVRTEDFSEGNLAVYIPIEALIPENANWARDYCGHLKFKNGVHRVKAVRLRGVFSMGMLIPFDAVIDTGKLAVPCPPETIVGIDVAELLGVTKYEEPEEAPVVVTRSRLPTWVPRPIRQALGWLYHLIRPIKKAPARRFPIYDVGHIRKAWNAFQDGEEIVMTEKIHGSNAVFMYDPKKGLIVSSHRMIRPVEDDSVWWRAAREYELARRLQEYPSLAFYGEVYGIGVQDLTYGVPAGQVGLRIFDIYDTKTLRYVEYDQACALVSKLNLRAVPVMYRGPYSKEKVMELKEGLTVVSGVKQIREGVVVRRVVEFNRETNEVRPRCVLKAISDAYLLRKDGSERH